MPHVNVPFQRRRQRSAAAKRAMRRPSCSSRRQAHCPSALIGARPLASNSAPVSGCGTRHTKLEVAVVRPLRRSHRRDDQPQGRAIGSSQAGQQVAGPLHAFGLRPVRRLLLCGALHRPSRWPSRTEDRGERVEVALGARCQHGGRQRLHRHRRLLPTPLPPGSEAHARTSCPCPGPAQPTVMESEPKSPADLAERRAALETGGGAALAAQQLGQVRFWCGGAARFLWPDARMPPPTRGTLLGPMCLPTTLPALAGRVRQRRGGAAGHGLAGRPAAAGARRDGAQFLHHAADAAAEPVPTRLPAAQVPGPRPLPACHRYGQQASGALGCGRGWRGLTGVWRRPQQQRWSRQH